MLDPDRMSSLFSKKRKLSRQNTNPTSTPTNPITFTQSVSKKTTAITSLITKVTFESLGIGKSLAQTCRALGLTHPTPVQRHSIPSILAGGHVLAISPTGSGKTAAFLLPILNKLMEDPYGIFAVVLSPTRELAQQIHEQVCALGSVLKVQSVLVCGGGDFVRQSCALQKQPHFLVATPGRLGEMMRNNAAAIKAGGKSLIKLNNVRFVVLDEADRLLSKNGFEKDVAEILSCTSKSRRCQTILFSATMTASLDEVSNMASGGRSRLPLQQFTVTADGELKENDSSSSGGEDEENDNSDGDSDSDSDGDNSNNTNSTNTNTNTIGSARIPAGLSQQYIFMPSKMRDVYLGE